MEHPTFPTLRRHRRRQLIASALALVLAATGALVAGAPAAAWESTRANSVCSVDQPARPAMRIQYPDAVPQAYRQALRAAAAAWEEALPGILTIEVSAQLPSTFHSNTSYVSTKIADGPAEVYATAGARECLTADHGTYDTAVITIYPSTMDGLSQQRKTWVMVHEIGHLLKLGHPSTDDSCRSVMGGSAWCDQYGAGPLPDDVAGVLASVNPSLTPGFPADGTIANAQGQWLSTTDNVKGSNVVVGDPFWGRQFGWTFVPTERGGDGPGGERSGWVVNTGSGLCLAMWTVGGARSATQQNCRELDQRSDVFWTVQARPDGAVALRNQRDGVCLQSAFGAFDRRAGIGDCNAASAVFRISRPEGVAVPPVFSPLQHPLVGQQSGRCLDIPGGRSAIGAHLIIYDCQTSSNQLFRFRDESRTLIAFEPSVNAAEDGLDSTVCVQADGVVDLSPVVTAKCRLGAPSQVWHRRGDGTIYNPASNKCMNVSGGATGNNSAIVLWSCNSEENEVFNALGVAGREPRFTIRTLLGTGKVLTSNRDFGELANDVDGENQVWSWRPAPNDAGSGLLVSQQASSTNAQPRCLTAPASGGTTKVAMCDPADAKQRWKASTNSNGSSTFTSVAWSGQCLDLTWSSTDDGTPIEVYGCKTSGDRRNQQWRLMPENPQHVIQGTSPVESPVSLVARANSRHVSVSDEQWPVLVPSATTVGGNELFDLVYNDDATGTVSLRSRFVDRYVSVGSSDRLYADANTVGDGEKFSLVESPEGWVALRAVKNGKYVVAEVGGDGLLFANRDSVGAWEKFDLIGNRHLPELGWNPALGEVALGRSSVLFDPRLDRYTVVARGAGGAVWIRDRRSSWTSWRSLGQPSGQTVAGTPAIVASGAVVDVYTRASDSRVYTTRSTDGGLNWGPWTKLETATTADAPAVARDTVTQLTHVVVRSTDGTLTDHVRSAGGQWAPGVVIPMGGVRTAGEFAVTAYATRIDVFLRGSDDLLYQAYSVSKGQAWVVVPGSTFGGRLSSSPAAAYDPVAQSYFVAAKGTDGKAYLNRWNGSWSGWTGIPGPTSGTFDDAPALVAYGFRAALVVRGTDGKTYYTPINTYY